MKKRILWLLIAVLLLSGCAAEAPAPADDLTPVLDAVAAHVFPGTAGSSLSAAQEACALMDWSCTTAMDETAVRTLVSERLAGLDDEGQALFSAQLSAVAGAAAYLRQDDGAGLLEDIGGAEGTLWPWPEAKTALIAALLEAAGVEESPFYAYEKEEPVS